MLLALLAAGTLAVLLLTLWITRGGSRPLASAPGQPGFLLVDVAAFRNLLSEDDEHFLRSSLTASHYRQVRRARLRAVQEYLLWMAENCATLMAWLRLGVADPGLESASDAATIARNALRVRMISLGFWMLLWIEFLLPGVEIRPAAALRQYEEVWRHAENYLRTHWSQPTVFSRPGLG